MLPLFLKSRPNVLFAEKKELYLCFANGAIETQESLLMRLEYDNIPLNFVH